MNKKKIFKFIFGLIFIAFIISYVIEESGYYEYNLRNKTVMTKESMERFEKDLKDGKDVLMEDYVVNTTKDYTSRLTTGTNRVSFKVIWWIWFILALLTIVLGVLVMFGESVMTLLGVSLIVDGVSDIVTTLWLSAGVRKVKKEIEKDEKDLGEMDEVK